MLSNANWPLKSFLLDRSVLRPIIYLLIIFRVKGVRYFDSPPLHGAMIRPDKVKVCIELCSHDASVLDLSFTDDPMKINIILVFQIRSRHDFMHLKSRLF